MTKVPENLISLALNTPKVSSAVVCANQKSVLESVREATDLNLIQPILIGEEKNILFKSSGVCCDIFLASSKDPP